MFSCNSLNGLLLHSDTYTDTLDLVYIYVLYQHILILLPHLFSIHICLFIYSWLTNHFNIITQYANDNQLLLDIIWYKAAGTKECYFLAEFLWGLDCWLKQDLSKT